MNVKLHIYFKTREGKTCKRVITYANPAASDEVLNNFVAKLNALTNNDLKSVLKVVNSYLDEESVIEDEITAADIASILDETYTPAEDEDISADIAAILAAWD